MLDIEIPGGEFYNQSTQEFIQIKGKRLSMEHSLISLSKWEARWRKPFLEDKPKTSAEKLDYIRCMTITSNVDPLLYKCLSQANMMEIEKYIDTPQTATTIREYRNSNQRRHQPTMTSEVIYSLMIGYNIPHEYERWHLSRLLTLIKLREIASNPKRKKMSRQEIFEQNRELNAARRAKYQSNG